MNDNAKLALAAAAAIGAMAGIVALTSPGAGGSVAFDAGPPPFDVNGKVTYQLVGPHLNAAMKAQTGEAQISDVQAADGTRLIMRRLNDGGVQVIGGAVTASTFFIGVLADGGAGLQDVANDRSDKAGSQ